MRQALYLQDILGIFQAILGQYNDLRWSTNSQYFTAFREVYYHLANT